MPLHRIASRVAVLAFLAALAASAAHAAPDEQALGKDEGYPLCAGELRPETRCIVGLVSRFDEIFPSRRIPSGASVLRLRRATAEPRIRYGYLQFGATNTIDDYLARTRTTGLLVLHGDTILVERYQYDRGPAHRMASYSMAKTFVAMLVGIALSEGNIRSLDDVAGDYVTELKGSAYGETRLRHLLAMASGVQFSEIYTGTDDAFTLGRLSILGESAGGAATLAPFRTRERAPGERFQYSSAETQVLGLVVRAATGRPLAEYLSEKVWQPMGAEADATWIVDAGGYEAAFIGINATLRDYARFGALLAHDGNLNGRQIVPAGWVKAATTPPGPQFKPGMTGLLLGYGYQTWIVDEKKRYFVARGLRGQALYVAPAEKIVMVRTAAGGVGEPSTGETLALFYGVVDSLKGRRAK